MGDLWALRAGQLTVLIEDGVVVDVGPDLLGEFPVVELDEDVTLLPRDAEGVVAPGAAADLLAVRGGEVIGVWVRGQAVRR